MTYRRILRVHCQAIERNRTVVSSDQSCTALMGRAMIRLLAFVAYYVFPADKRLVPSMGLII
eukprot:scaffold169276_cov22-Prasinocladus_malaysianus.AAC.1